MSPLVVPTNLYLCGPPRVALTGAAGFIGGYIAAELMRRGYEVIGIDNYSKYGKPDHDPGFIIEEADAKDVSLLSGLLRSCDFLIAGAAMIGGIEYFHRLPFSLLAENDKITAAACEAAISAREKTKRLQRVVYLSSSMVYESTDVWPSMEGDERRIPPPLSSYGFSKLAVEYYARAAWDQHKLPYTIVRPFNCVGVGEDAKMSHVVPDLVRKVLSGQDPLRIYGDGTQVRHYTYGKDLARGIADAMESPGALNDDFNLSSPHSTTVLELAEMIWRKLRPDMPFRYISDQPFEHDIQRRIPDTSKAERVLGFKAETSLSDMVDVVIESVGKSSRALPPLIVN